MKEKLKNDYKINNNYILNSSIKQEIYQKLLNLHPKIIFPTPNSYFPNLISSKQNIYI